MLRIGVIGVGRIGAFHAEVLAANPAVAEVVTTDIDGTLAAAVAENCRGRSVDTVEALLGSVDAVVITASTSEHASLIGQVVEAGLPAFCEKPIAIDLDSTRLVVEKVRRAGTVVQMGFQRRFDTGFRRAQRLVAAGDAGTLYLVRMAGHDPHPPHESYVPNSGGIFRDLHIHDFDIARFVTGQEVTEVYADGGVISCDFIAKYDDVDTAVATLRFSGGAFGILSGTRHNPLGYDVRMEVFGSGDSFSVGLNDRTPLRSVEDGGPAAPTDAYRFFLDRFGSAYRAELDVFVEVVQGRASNPCPPEDALEAMRVAVACDLSRREHRPVAIREI